MSLAGYFGVSEQKERLALERRLGESVEAVKMGRPDGETLPGGLKRARDESRFYEGVGDYDPVLRSHCRLEKL